MTKVCPSNSDVDQNQIVNKEIYENDVSVDVKVGEPNTEPSNFTPGADSNQSYAQLFNGIMIGLLKRYNFYTCTIEEIIIHDYVDKATYRFNPFCCCHSSKKDTINEYSIQYNCTPLCLAVKFQRIEIIYILLHYGADPNLPDKSNKRTPLMFSAYLDNMEISTALIQSGANMDQSDDNMITPLMIACSRNKINIRHVELLIENHANLDSQDINGWTCLHYAVHSQSPQSKEVLRYLITAGVDKNIKDHNKLTAFNLAELLGYDQCVMVLMQVEGSLV